MREAMPATRSSIVPSCSSLGWRGTSSRVSERSAMRLKGNALRAKALRLGIAM
ncbi:hypothetical protein D9M70_536280 [compost metagenome]